MEKVSFSIGSNEKIASLPKNDPIQITLKKEPEKIAENIFTFKKTDTSNNSNIVKSGNKPTICFATMCKNEEHCIKETLENVYKYIDYWVVCDTGSTDNTCKIVEDFFKEKNIPGELHVDEWKGFDINKTILFNHCYKKADYILDRKSVV